MPREHVPVEETPVNTYLAASSGREGCADFLTALFEVS